MARIRYNEFVDFCTTGKIHRNGNLLMKGNEVYSYRARIAIVDRDAKTIKVNSKDYSRTTSCHQRAVTMGARFLGDDWTIAASEGL